MRIDQIRLVNFRQYRDALIELGSSTESATVFVGKTGAGKTNLLNAITWCLYGYQQFGAKTSDDRSMPLVNVGPLGESLRPGPTSCSVEIRLSFDDGRSAVVRRKQGFEVGEAGRSPVPVGQPDFSIQMMNSQRGFDSVADTDAWIRTFMPERVRPYYILNTERLEQFFHQDTESTRVRDAILQIAQIDLLVRMRKRLETVKGDLYSAARSKDTSGLLGILERERKQLDEDRQRIESDIDAKGNELELLDGQIASIDRRMGDFEEAAHIVAERAEKETRLAAVVADYDAAETEMIKSLAKDAPAVLAYDAVRGLRAHIEEAWKAGRIPAPVHPDYLQRLLDETVCVCGRELCAGSEAAEAVEAKRKGQLRATVLGQFLQTQSGPAAVLVNKAEGMRQVAGAAQQRLAKLAAEARELKARVDQLTQQMAELGVESESFGILKQQWDQAQKAREKTRMDVALAKRDLETLRVKLDEVERKLNVEMRKDRNQQELSELVRFTEKCLDAVGQAYQELITETRERVSAALNASFLGDPASGLEGMIWKKETYASATIDDEYNVCVRHADGYHAGSDLSGGEDVCLALAFSQALGEVSGFELPLIFDSPLVKLDDEVKVRVAKSMGLNLRGRQLVLLMKPDEFNQDVRAALSENVSVTVANLEFDEAGQSTSIVS